MENKKWNKSHDDIKQGNEIMQQENEIMMMSIATTGVHPDSPTL